jgi:succinate-semialdehyde dehydrogenase/glutarate-semialdehyde dehydrogenase
MQNTTLGHPTPIYSKMRNYQTLNPATGRLVESFPEISDAETQAALSRANNRFSDDWKFHRITDRAQVVARAAVIMRARAEELAALITLERGKLIGESLLEVELSAAILEYYATHAEEFLRVRQVPEAPGSVIVTQPLGVIMAVEP